MIKEEKITKIIIEKRRYCDDCGKELFHSLACSKTICEYCKKDLCGKCIGHEDHSGGDYRIVFCKTCWDLGNKYRPKITKLSNEIDRLYIEWQTKCKYKNGIE